MVQENANSEWDPEQERTLQQVQAAMQASLPLGPHNLADAMILEVINGRKRCQLDFTADPDGKISNRMPPFLEQAHDICIGKLYIFR